MTVRTELYRHWNKAGELLYVGISLSAVSRLGQHMRQACWSHEVARVTIEVFPSRQAAEDAERTAIRQERPRYNVAHSPDRVPSLPPRQKRGAKLTVAEVQAAAHSGRSTAGGKMKTERLADGDGLYLQLAPEGSKSWLFRYTLAGKAREMGLGPVALADDKPGVTLAAARREVAKLHALLREGRDPIAERQARRASAAAEAQAAATRGKTFREVAEAFVAAHEASWTNLKHYYQWRSTLATYAFPVFGDSPVAAVGTAEVQAALAPIWATKTETATRLRGRIERILDYARVAGFRDGDNPARWRGHLEYLLPPLRKGRLVGLRIAPCQRRKPLLGGSAARP